MAKICTIRKQPPRLGELTGCAVVLSRGSGCGCRAGKVSPPGISAAPASSVLSVSALPCQGKTLPSAPSPMPTAAKGRFGGGQTPPLAAQSRPADKFRPFIQFVRPVTPPLLQFRVGSKWDGQEACASPRGSGVSRGFNFVFAGQSGVRPVPVLVRFSAGPIQRLRPDPVRAGAVLNRWVVAPCPTANFGRDAVSLHRGFNLGGPRPGRLQEKWCKHEKTPVR